MTRHYLESDDVLVDGSWQPERGVLRWVPGEPPPPNLRLLVACPFCRAAVSQTCRSTGGHPVAPHTVRLAPRLCACGELLGYRKQLCEFCRLEARTLTYRRRETRQPTKTRRAA